VVGAHLEERSRKPLYRLAKSKSLWERGLAIVATLHFIRRIQFEDTLAISKILLEDKQDRCRACGRGGPRRRPCRVAAALNGAVLLSGLFTSSLK
jgi:hypothetical protein